MTILNLSHDLSALYEERIADQQFDNMRLAAIKSTYCFYPVAKKPWFLLGEL